LLVWPRLEYDAARGIRNTAILIDREGSVVGKYDKMFPTIGEIERGIVPGTEAPVFETEIGRIGMLICFDLNIAEVRDSLKRGHPDIVVYATN
jgi:predicted amidohydrolase